jgi:hypothetical protein
VRDEFARLGVTIETNGEVEEQTEEIAVWPENWTSLVAWLSIDTQWRVTSTMRQLVYIGLDYTAVKAVLDAEGHGPGIFADIRMMEAAALPHLNEAE